jgi:hypothetical protein
VHKAINGIKTHSACPSYEIPAKILKECKETLSLPLQLFFNKSFNCGTVPNSYKIQQVIPIFKKGLKTKASNFRGVTLNPHTFKILERIIRVKLVHYFEINGILNCNQHGFRQSRSCATQLVTHISNVQNHLINNNDVDTIYIDFAKAFDKVDHRILINKLRVYGLPDKYIRWINNFISGRRQYVFINGSKSYEASVESGVPQGSVLGPLLFIIFINDLPDNINHSQMLTFADDTKIVRPISSSQDTFLLQKDLDAIIDWACNNNMQLNKDKFELISHNYSKNNKYKELFTELPFHSTYNNYFTGQSFISPSDCVRDLGIFIDDELSWERHISNLCRTGKRLVAWVLNVFYARDKLTMLTLFNSLIRSRLEYCSQIWDPSKVKLINDLEQLQRSFTRRIMHMSNFNYWERLTKLNIFSLQRRREKLTLIYVWKIKNDFVPNDINLQFSFNSRKSRFDAVVKPMPKVRGRLLSMYESSFQIKAAKLWNKIPNEITSLKNLTAFKERLNKYLTLYPDRPPISGYYHITKNSLLDYQTIKFKV